MINQFRPLKRSGTHHFRRVANWAIALVFATMSVAGHCDDIDYNRDIRPILADNCFACHGPDDKHREADLQLDTQDAAHKSAIVPGKPDQSDLIKRIVTHDLDDRMPPEKTGKTLTRQEIDTLRRWIESGAKYQGHWSFVRPTRPQVPDSLQGDWPRNPIDQFVLAKLHSEDLQPSPTADKSTLIRRVSLDLTGLPPTPQEIQAFVQDESPNAYEKVVDRLLASKRYGERMGLIWLDAARYADTHGYQADNPREMWIWRNWVIDAYNANKPFDEFTVEQIAGDMLPDATIDQQVATGFNRNHRINGEGGVIPEEYRVEYVIDRVSTTGTVWLGLTLGCARCHSHKFDPISQTEFYQLFSYFNNIPENGRDGGRGNATPVLSVPIPQKQGEVDAARQRIAELEQRLNADSDELRAERKAWETRQLAKLGQSDKQSDWSIPTVTSVEATNNVTLKLQEDESYLATGTTPTNSTYTVKLKPGKQTITGLRLETLRHPSFTNGGLSRSVNGNFVMTEFELLQQASDADKPRPVKIASAVANYSQTNYPIRQAIDGNKATGWAILGRTKVTDTTAAFTLAEPLDTSEDTTLIVRMKHDSQFAAHAIGRFRLTVTSADKPSLKDQTTLPLALAKALQTPRDQRSDKQSKQILAAHRDVSRVLAPIRKQLAAARKRLEAVTKQATTSVMVMREMPTPRQAYYLNRGQYDQPGDPVQPGIPASLGAIPDKQPNNRLGFARWLVHPSNPLTARVAVNRYWQMYFGTGLVKSSSDFGAQGEWPSHPKLLDWLAVEFVESGWDVKAMQKLIVMSATYRQSSHGTTELLDRDPANRLLARGPRFRLSGFTIRDQALAIAGLLSDKLGGPSVKPYQPAGLWSDVSGRANGNDYRQGTGEELYRRSMYTFWKRAVAPPTMIIFDASGREACNVDRNTTNTPLQSLATLNDVQFVEAARFMAQRMMLESGPAPNDRLAYGWQLALARQPDDNERKRLLAAYNHHLSGFQADVTSAQALLAIGDSPRDDSLDVAQHAAYTVIANVILNLDEVVTKE